MSGTINLSAAIRNSLLSLQNSQTLTNTTQNALSTGLKVNNAVDNPVSYFQASALSDRSTDFSQKKDGIDQGVSSLSTALEGVNGIQSLVSQLQGLTLNAESATGTQEVQLVTQFNALRTQINTLAKDTQYQGLNLIAGSGQTLTVSFSTVTASNLTVNSVDVTSGVHGLNIAKVYTAIATGTLYTPLVSGGKATTSNLDQYLFNFSGRILTGKISGYGGSHASGTTVGTFVYAGTASTLKSGYYALKFGTLYLQLKVGSAGSTLGSAASLSKTQAFTLGEKFSVYIAAGTSKISGTVATSNRQFSAGDLTLYYGSGQINANASGTKFTAAKLKYVTGQYTINSAVQPLLQDLFDQLQTNLTSLRSQAHVIGSNVALLNTRLDFTNNYVNLLTAGAGKLTLADLNSEGADLLSLQTQQQLGIQALSFAGQSERAVLQLFR